MTLLSVPVRAPLAVLVLSVLPLAAQGGPPPGSREAMWPAPTDEDWARPCLVQWQRTWDDAVAVSQETGKAILVCVNMDGEIASEHYAGIRYRQPEIASLYEPYVTVIASVYRHTPRDHDEHGNRIPCPRFGGVTCGEHISIEPLLYEKFMDGRRIAPRHIMVELDGSETYDVFYAFDTDSVFQAIREGIANREHEPTNITRGDRTITERVAGRDYSDRLAVEEAYQQGDAAQRRSLLEAAIAAGDAASVDLLRLAVFGVDPELAALARQALAKAEGAGAADLINEALRAPMAAAERDQLVGALGRIGEQSPRARTLAVVHRGLGGRSRAVDLDGWAQSLRGAEYPAQPAGFDELATRIDEREQASTARPQDAAAQLDLAVASLALALDPETAEVLPADRRNAGRYLQLMFEDARRAAEDAERLGAEGWKLDAVFAVVAHNTGDAAEAYRRAEAAVAALPAGVTDREAAAVLELFAHGRQRAISAAVVDKERWPPEWLSDLDAAYSVLSEHPLGTEQHIVDHYDFMAWLRARGRASRVLDRGLARYPDSAAIHERLRKKVLRERGVEGLQRVYDDMLAAPDATASTRWFAGYAAMVAGEFHRRASDGPPAAAAYDRAIAHFEACAAQEESFRDSAEHQIAMAMAGQARVALDAGNLDAALALLLATFERRPESAATLDGMNLSAVATAQMLRAVLRQAGRDEQAATLQAALDGLDPELLEMPAFEREAPLPGNGG